MKLYKIVAITGDKQDKLTKFVGSQAAAAAHRKELGAAGFKRTDITTTEVDVPTSKDGLIDYLNYLLADD